MNLRLPVVAGVAAVAAAAAVLRGTRPAAPPAPLAIVTAAPHAAPAALARKPQSRLGGPAGRVVVYVAGNVVRGGVYTLAAGARGIDALHAAGGVTTGADPIAVNLAKPLVDGEELVFPAKGRERPSAARERLRPAASRAARKPGAKRRRKRPAARVSSDSGDSAGTAAPDEVVDVNAADESTLETLPGIGSALAARIALVREQSGSFASLDDLLDVNGMTQAKLDAIAPYVTLR